MEKQVATNPCGEVPAPWNVCNLGHINLAEFVKDGDVDWDMRGLRFMMAFGH